MFTNYIFIWAGQSEKRTYGNFRIFVRNISVLEYCISFDIFCTNALENEYYSIFLKRLNRMLHILKWDVIYYVIYVI